MYASRIFEIGIFVGIQLFITEPGKVPVFNMLTLDKVDNFGYSVLTVTNMSLRRVEQLYGDRFRINFTFTYAGDRCNKKGKMTAVADARYTRGLDVIVGPVCGSDLEIIASMAGSWNIPIISPSGSSSAIATNKTEFPTLTNMAFTMDKFALFYMDIFKFYKWKDIVIIYQLDQPLIKLLTDDLNEVFIKGNITTVMMPFAYGVNDFKPLLMKASKHSRVFVAICIGDDFRKIMLDAHDLRMTNGDYAHLFIQFYEINHTSRAWERGDLFDERAREAYDSVLVLQPKRPTSFEFKKFVEEVKTMAFDRYNYSMKNEEVSIFTTAFYDSIMVYAQVVDEILKAGGDVRDGRHLCQKMLGRTFKGISGDINIDDNGDRDPDFQLLDLDIASSELGVVAEYSASNRSLRFIKEIHWPSLKGPPANIPACGFLGDAQQCRENESNHIGLIVGLLLAVLIGLTIACVIIYRRVKQEVDLRDQWWNIQSADLVFSSHLSNSRQSKFSMLASTDEIKSNKVDVASSMAVSSLNRKIALHKGIVVSVVKTPATKITITRDLLVELKNMRELNCNNVAKVVGLYRSYNGAFIVIENCTRGSLQDIMQNDSLDLDWDFKAALLTDVVNGMNYLHDSPILIHGRLNSERCIIDSRFVLKISEFGLPSVLGRDPLKYIENEKEYLWFAPECLRGTKVSQAGDVYSFGIILYEILTRMSPYEEELESLTLTEMLQQIKTKGIKPFRPSLNHIRDIDKPEIIELMVTCWDDIFFKRPTFRHIKKQLRGITGISASHNILDSLLRRMEQYANNLEELVGQRTEAFLDEKRKSDQLLEQVLPSTVADRLKNNKSVFPEAFECVTIYFSDIVGFTVLSAMSSAMEVVDFLNDLYCAFDAIIELYDVYKVETIGDAYMVVSGLPTRNGNDHVRQIAMMSLDILRNVKLFKIRHLPDRCLMARIGIHSGPVCAGVVGSKMPRYCLFGDTVNTASRMESHGKAMRIHVSPSSRELLQNCDEFHLQSRGEIEIKGKGKMITYWLTGAGTPGSINQSPDRKSWTERDEDEDVTTANEPSSFRLNSQFAESEEGVEPSADSSPYRMRGQSIQSDDRPVMESSPYRMGSKSIQSDDKPIMESSPYRMRGQSIESEDARETMTCPNDF